MDTACGTLESAGFACEKRPRAGVGTPANVVLNQVPAANANALRGTNVQISFYASEGTVVPAINGYPTAERHCEAVMAAGLNCVPRAGASPSAVGRNKTYATVPTPGSRLAGGSTVTVYYDSASWTQLWQCNDPGSYRLTLTTGSCATGWRRTALGFVTASTAAWTEPLYCISPVSASNDVSDECRRESAPPPRIGFGPARLIGRIPIPGVPARRIYVYQGSVQSYFSTSANDSYGINRMNQFPTPYTQPAWETFD